MPLQTPPPAHSPARLEPAEHIAAGAVAMIVIVGDATPPCPARSQALSALAFKIVTAYDTAAVALSRLQRVDLFLVEGEQQFAANYRFYLRRRVIHGAKTIVIGEADCPEARLKALDLGADDAVAANCSTRELWARIKAVLNLHRPLAASGADPRYVIEGAGEFRPRLMTLHLTTGASLPLNRLEASLLDRLIQARGGAVSRDTILDGLPINLAEVFDRSVDQNVRRLRRRLASHDIAGLIETCPGGGYRLGASARRIA